MLKFLKCSWLRCCALVSLVVLLAGCSWFSSDKDELDAADVLSPLEVPPDLVRPYGKDKLVSAATAVSPQKIQQVGQLPSVGERVLPQGKGVQRLRDGQHRWLMVSAEPEQVWPLALKFLEMRGYRISVDEPAVGLIETDWKNRFDGSDDNGLPNLREQLRLRLEPFKPSQGTEVYLSQTSSVRVKSLDVDTSSVDKTLAKKEQWQLQGQDDGRAIEMLNRFARFLAAEDVEDAVPLKSVASKLGANGDGGTVLIVNADFARVWRRTGIALDALGFTIEDRDRNSRIYSVYNELSRGKSEEELEHGKPQSATVRESYRIQLDQEGETTLLSVRTQAGQVDNSDVAVHVLNLLHSQFQ